MENGTTMPDSQPAPVMPVFKKRAAKANMRKRPAPPKDSDSEEEFSSEDESGQRVIKKRRKAGVAVTSTNAPRPAEPDAPPTTTGPVERSAAIAPSSDATKQSNWYDEPQMDEKSLLGTTRKSLRGSENSTAAPAPDGTYKGLKSYSNFLPKNPDAPVSKFTAVGPIAPHSANIRTVTVTDYAPDVCKDFRVTGYCGFGDSCKFLHDRSDIKQGWALDRDWELDGGGRRQHGGTVVASRSGRANADGGPPDDKEAAALAKIPFKCVICKDDYRNPVVTRCEHYFCQKCALARYRRDPTCAVCGAGTNGVFNVAGQLKKLLEKKREREERREKAEREKSEKGE